MERDAFTGGVEPGGLWNKNDIRILLCYVLSSVNAPLSREELSRCLQERGLANYFEIGDALDALERQGHVTPAGEEGYAVTPSGREIAGSLDATLPLSVREKAVAAALRLLAEARSRRENRVDTEETPQGYRVTCHISGGESDLMAVSLFVPDRRQAELVTENFYRDPGGVYRLLLSALTGDSSYARAFFDGEA